MTGLKLGYKASAEQFGPRELVELAVCRRGARDGRRTVATISSRGGTRAVTRRSRWPG